MDIEIHSKLAKEEPVKKPDDTQFVKTVESGAEVEPQEVGLAIINLMTNDWDLSDLVKTASEMTTQDQTRIMKKEEALKFFEDLDAGGSLSKIAILLDKPTNIQGGPISDLDDIKFAIQIINGQITNTEGHVIQIKQGVSVILIAPEDKNVIKDIIDRLNNNDGNYTTLGLPTQLKDLFEKLGQTAPNKVLGCKTGQYFITIPVETIPDPNEIDTQPLD